MRKISLLTGIGILLAFGTATPHAAYPTASARCDRTTVTGPTVEISTSIKEARRGQVILEIDWHMEQENRAIRPSEASIIAILIGARGKEYKVLSNTQVKASGPLSGSARVVINHEEQYQAPIDTRFVITVGFKREGKADGLPSRTKEFVLRVAEKN